jgi:dihydrolipoamide dehydrogenase
MNENYQYDILIIGSGPGGYTCAIKAAHLGYKVAIAEKYAVLGGTCTNVGCIPAKALLDSSEHYFDAVHKFAAHGISAPGPYAIDFTKMIARKQEVVKQNNSGLDYLMKKNKITVLHGTAAFIDAHTLLITGGDTEYRCTAANFVIATGSKPSSIPGITIDKKRIITSTEALSLTALPQSMIIIGGGVIGVETASTYARLGTRVTVIEYLDAIVPAMDREMSSTLKKLLEKIPIAFKLGSRVESVFPGDDSVEVTYTDQDGQTAHLSAEYCVVATGRRAYPDQLNLKAVGISQEPNGKILVDEQLRTSLQHVYAIGDVIRGPMLAHKAEDEGIFVAEVINGQKPHINYNLIPSVVYTWPEAASVGQTEEQLKTAGIEYSSGKFPYLASGRARAAGETDGFVKVLISPKYGEVLGVHIIGPRAADVIAQCVVGMEYEVTAEDMYRICYAHPTYSEALKDAFFLASGVGAINY